MQLPLGFFTKDMTVFVNLEVGKSSPLRKIKVDKQFFKDFECEPKDLAAFHFSNITPCDNYDFVNAAGGIWRRNNATMEIEWVRKTPEFCLP